VIGRVGQKPWRLALAAVVLTAAAVGLLQLSPPCREWRAWKESKRGPGFHTMELMTRPFFCIGSEQP
jgi:hypothetical protein